MNSPTTKQIAGAMASAATVLSLSIVGLSAPANSQTLTHDKCLQQAREKYQANDRRFAGRGIQDPQRRAADEAVMLEQMRCYQEADRQEKLRQQKAADEAAEWRAKELEADAETARQAQEASQVRQKKLEEAQKQLDEKLQAARQARQKEEEALRKAEETRRQIQAEDQRRQAEERAAAQREAWDRLSPDQKRARTPCHPTMAQYEKIEIGTSLQDVQEVLGCNGEENSRTEASGKTLVFQTFGDLSNGMISLWLVDGKVTSKSQFGVKE